MVGIAEIASPILETVIEKLGSGIWKELELLWGVKKDFEKLQKILATISNVLDDAERRSISSKALRDWLRDLKDAAFDADDVVDEFQTEALRRRIKRGNRITGKVSDFFSSNNPIAFRYKMSHKIKDVRERFNEIAQLRRDFHLTEGSSSSKINIDRETYSCINETEVYGRDDDKEKIIHFLLNMDNDKDVSVLPIVGLGGVGKTTLAQLIYNDMRVKEYFELRIWVCVSEEFDVKGIAKTITERITKNECTASDLETIQQCLQQQLRDKKFMIVLDDIWNENVRKWERLKSLLQGGRVGSKIIVTTRSNTVAMIMCTVETPHKLNVLSEHNCWILFKHRAFRLGKEENPKLVEIGKEIVRKCGGLPLAAKALGSLMATKYEEIEWLDVQNNEMWRLPENEVEIIAALKLSYDYLPPHLKHCFAYCSLFSKDSKIYRLKLIQLWIAEGFIPIQEKGMSAEDVGNQYFNSLLWRSFFQEEQRNDFGDIEWCKMHDLMHDLACSVADGESCIVQVGREPSVVDLHRCRYVSVDSAMCIEIRLTTIELVCEAKLLRSLILCDPLEEHWNKSIERSAIYSIPNLIYLRALDLSRFTVEELPDVVRKLKHLRFLDLSNTSIRVLPDSITNLYNLQTLILKGCSILQELPEGIRNMSNLRHLDIGGCRSLTCMPRGFGKLRSLQTLSLFIVGEEPGRTIVELQHLNLLRSNLKIKYLHRLKDSVEAREARLSEKTSLQGLELSWGNVQSRVSVDADVLENLQPPANLRSLKIENYSGNRLPRWLTGIDASLPFFPSLKSLVLENMPNIEEWLVPERAAGFPCLEKLRLSNCPKLTVQPYLPSSILELTILYCNEELLVAGGSLQGLSRLRKLEIETVTALKSGWEGLQHLTGLQELKIINCHNLTCLPEGVMKLPSLQSLTLFGNGNLESLSSRRGGGGEVEPLSQPLFFNTLLHLQIVQSHELTALPEWLGCLTSLQSLSFGGCYKLEMLPDGMKHLASLRTLWILGSPIVERRCERERGDDWHKIAHIPHIQIGPVWNSE